MTVAFRTLNISGSIDETGGLVFGDDGTVDILAPGLLQAPGFVLGTADVTGVQIDVETGGTLQSLGPALASGDLSIHIGSGLASQAAIDVAGSGASLDSGGWSVLVGEEGTGTLTIEDGASGSDGGLDTSSPYSTSVAAGVDSNGTLIVTGSGSTYHLARALVVGEFYGAAGSVTLSDGGILTTAGTASAGSANIDIGAGEQASGSVTVDSGAVLNAGVTGLIVGDSGSGTLVVQGGTVLTSAAGYSDHEAALIIGNAYYDGVGSVTIDGAGSTLTADGAVLVGQAGTGELTVSNGGALSAGGTNDAGTGLVVDAGGVIQGGTLLVNDGTVTVTDNALIDSGATLALGLGTGLAGDHSAISVGDTLTIAENGTLTSGGHADTISGTLADDGYLTVTHSLAIAGALSVGQPGTEAGLVSVDNGVLTVSGDAEINAGGTLLLGGTSTVSVAGTFTVGSGGTVNGNGGYGTVAGPVLDDGTVEASTGDIEITGAVSGTGTLGLGGTNTLRLDGSVAAGVTVAFLGSASGPADEVLSLGTPLAMDATIEGFASGDAIDFATAAGSVRSSFSGDTMIVTGGGATLAELTFALGYDATNTFAYDQQGAVSIYTIFDGSGSAPCFVSGTRIWVATGEVAVERLRIGDRVRTAGGALRPVRWIGHRTIFRADADQAPVRIAAFAFGDAPVRDLYLSGDHCVLCRDALVPVKALVNGVSVARVPRRQVTYWHVELETHDVLLAEGLPAETYLDTGNRHAFAGGAVTSLRADFSPGPVAAAPCWPIVTDGPAVVAAKQRLLAPLAWTEEPDVALCGAGGTVLPDRYGDWFGFIVPAGQVRLRSRNVVAAQARAASFDQRRLGVAVTAIHVDGRPIGLDDARLGAGWHAPEPGVRWTDGDAALDLTGAVHLDVRVVAGAMRYPAQTDAATAIARRRAAQVCA